MPKQSMRQQARRDAVLAQSRRRSERMDRVRRLDELAVQVLAALRERDAAVTDAEQRAGVALRAMTEQEHLTMKAAAEWCGDELTVAEVTRLRRITSQTAVDGAVRP